MQLSEKAQDALRRIYALRRLPVTRATQLTEQKILEHLPLKDLSDVALALAEEKEANQ
jgi:hypothetical protein